MRRAALWLLVTIVFSTAVLASASAETVGPLPTGAAAGASQNDWISGMACPAAGDCTAVGGYVDSDGNDQGLLETESGGVWSAQGLAGLPAQATQPQLSDVACASAGNCVAVGQYDDANGYPQGLIVTESDGHWSASEAPLGPGADSDPLEYLASVSCPAVGDCVAVGTYRDASGLQGLIETESNGVWSASEAALPSPSSSSPDLALNDVSCSSAQNCVAVGDYHDENNAEQGLIETETAGNWTASEADLANLSTPSDPQVELESVSCPVDGSCSVVGIYLDSGNSYEGLLVAETAGAWQPATEATLPDNASTDNSPGNPAQYDLYLNSVSCAAAGSCTAVGSYDATSADDVEALTLSETGGAWADAPETAAPADAASDPNDALDSVACLSAGNCVAAGTYETTSGDNATLIDQQVAGTWSSPADVVQFTPYDDYEGDFMGVSCAPGGYCAVGGFTQDDSTGNLLAEILDAPAAPSIQTASASGTQVTVSWSAPADNGGSPVTGYTVTATDVTNAARGGQTASAGSSSASAVITGLTAGDTYTFSVSADSPLGTGLAATSASVQVPPTPTSPQPQPQPQPPASQPSVAVISSSLGALLTPHGATAKLKRLRRTHSYVFGYHAVEAGVVTVRWYHITGHGKHRHKALVASGKATAKGAGVIKLVVRLTAAGKRLVAHSGHHLHLTADVTFAGAGTSVLRVHAFTLS